MQVIRPKIWKPTTFLQNEIVDTDLDWTNPNKSFAENDLQLQSLAKKLYHMHFWPFFDYQESSAETRTKT